MGEYMLDKKTNEKKTGIERKSTKVRVNTSTHCHQFSLLQPVILGKAGRKSDKKGFNENITGMKLLLCQFYQDVC